MKGKRGWALVLLVGSAVLLMTQWPQAQEQESAGLAERLAMLQTRMTQLDPRVHYLRDRREIFDASQRFMRGADRHDKELARSAFWPEATISYGVPMGRDAFIDWDERRLAGYAAHQHHLTGQTVEVSADTAHVESYVIVFLVPRDTSADAAESTAPGRALTTEKTRVGSGRFVDRWERREGEWRIQVREYIDDLVLLGDTIDYCATRKCQGTWDRSDPSYARPLLPLGGNSPASDGAQQ